MTYVYYLAKIVWSIAGIFLTAFVMSTLWGWFAVPAGAPNLPTAHIYGLSLVLTAPFTGLAVCAGLALDDEKLAIATWGGPLLYLVPLAIGWIIKTGFMP